MQLVEVVFDYKKPANETCKVTLICSEKILERLSDLMELENEKDKDDSQMSLDLDYP